MERISNKIKTNCSIMSMCAHCSRRRMMWEWKRKKHAFQSHELRRHVSRRPKEKQTRKVGESMIHHTRTHTSECECENRRDERWTRTHWHIGHSTPELDGPIRKASLALCLQRLLLLLLSNRFKSFRKCIGLMLMLCWGRWLLMVTVVCWNETHSTWIQGE